MKYIHIYIYTNTYIYLYIYDNIQNLWIASCDLFATLDGGAQVNICHFRSCRSASSESK